MLTIRLMGSFELSGEGGDVTPVTSQQSGLLLAFLALSSERGYTRDEVMTALWPDDDPIVTRQRLRQYLYALRQLLTEAGASSDALITTRSTMRLNPGSVKVDVAQIDEAIAQAAREIDPHVQAELLAVAVKLIRGELLPGYYNECFDSSRRRLEQTHLDALHRLALAYEATGQLDLAIESARKAVAANPLMEEAHCALMRLFAAAGQPSSVLRQYQEMERALQVTVGEAPSPNARALLDSLRQSATFEAGPTSVLHSNSAPIGVSSLPVPSAPLRQPALARPSGRQWMGLTVSLILVFCLVGWVSRAYRRGAPPAKVAVVTPEGVVVWSTVLPFKPGDKGSEPTGLSVDSAGNTFITGFVDTLATDVDFITAKFDPAGKKVWEKRHDGPGHDLDRARSITVVGDLAIAVTGESDNGHGNDKTRLSGLDIQTIQYSRDGARMWEHRWNGLQNGEDRPTRIVAGPDYFYVSGYTWLAVNGDGTPRFAYIVLSYHPNGNLRWSRTYTEPGAIDCRATDLTVLDGEPIVTGFVQRKTEAGIETECVTIRYRQRDGRVQWTRRVGASPARDDYSWRIISGARGGFFICGRSHNQASPEAGEGTDYLLARYDGDGNLKWQRTYNGPEGRTDSATAMATDTLGRICVTGESESSRSNLDIVTLLYDAQGNLVWEKRFEGVGRSNDASRSATVCPITGAFCVSGFTTAKLTAGANLAGRNMASLCYAPSGASRWWSSTDGSISSNDFASSVAGDPRGGFIVTGQSYEKHGPQIRVMKLAP